MNAPAAADSPLPQRKSRFVPPIRKRRRLFVLEGHAAVLERVAQDDPSAPPLFELRPEYVVEPAQPASALESAMRGIAGAATNCLMFVAYYAGLGIIAPMMRSRDPMRLAHNRAIKWCDVAGPSARDQASLQG